MLMDVRELAVCLRLTLNLNILYTLHMNFEFRLHLVTKVNS